MAALFRFALNWSHPTTRGTKFTTYFCSYKTTQYLLMTDSTPGDSSDTQPTDPAEDRNHLADEASPYLRQHADNPVHWRIWDEATLARAREQDKPILLSIGYSTCHWCHVMAGESFADPATAAVMNDLYVCIKVDREERPDLDKVYQTALQLIGQQGGGWPLTMFLDPQTLLPFFGGTYFPDQPRHQLPGFQDLLRRLHEVFSNQRDEITGQFEQLKSTLERLQIPVLDATMGDLDVLHSARQALDAQYDPQEGGFGRAPKFPMHHALERILRHWAYTRKNPSAQADKNGLDMFMISLTQMARGGIYDHLGGGFCRYATDAKWMVPHFEKMLYDNAQLLHLYADALRLGPDELFSTAISETIGWLQRDLRAPGGAFYAATDADSEGEEGRFYAWRREQIKPLLNETEYLIVETLYGLDKPANFGNKWNLHRHDSWRSVVQRLSLDRPAADESLASAKQKLFAAREQRVKPAVDAKILTAWNALLIRGLATAGEVLGESAWLDSAQQVADFLRTQCWVDGTLYATYQHAPTTDADSANGQVRHPGYLDDYANLLYALTELLQRRWRQADVDFACELADALLATFYDRDNGGFFFTSSAANDADPMIHRPKPTMDEALPPGNGTAAQGLLALGHLLGKSDYLDAAHNTLRWARALLEKVPAAHCNMLHSLEQTVYAPELIILRGPVDEAERWRQALPGGFAPWRQVYVIPYADNTTLPEYLPRLVSMEQQAGVTAYVCSNLQCSLPITNLDALLQQID